MGRRMKHGVKLGPVADYPVAPHRYLWDKTTPDDLAITWREVRDAAPYKVGEVVFVVYGDGFRRAYVGAVDVTKDRWDDWRECYQVFPETKAGQWSKLYYTAHPGFVQRGYQRAGLAPEMPPEGKP